MSNVKTKVWGTDLQAMVAATDKAEGRERKGTRIMDAQMFAPFRAPPAPEAADPKAHDSTPLERQALPAFAGAEAAPNPTRILPIEQLLAKAAEPDSELVPSLKPRRMKLVAYALLTFLSLATWSFAKLRTPRAARAGAALHTQASATRPPRSLAPALAPAPVPAAATDPRSAQAARAAVDALARGDRDLAARLYGELALEDPSFAAAARILATPYPR